MAEMDILHSHLRNICKNIKQLLGRDDKPDQDVAKLSSLIEMLTCRNNKTARIFSAMLTESALEKELEPEQHKIYEIFNSDC